MAVKLTKLTHKIAIQLHVVAESYNIYSSPSRPPARKLLDTPSYDSDEFKECHVNFYMTIPCFEMYSHYVFCVPLVRI